jgi:hypothetical protein
MKNMQYVISAVVGILLLAGCGTKRGPKSVGQGTKTVPAANPTPEVTVKPPPPTTVRTAPPAPVASVPNPPKLSIPPERAAAIVGEWSRHWLSGATGSTYRVSFKPESGLSMTSLEEGVSVDKMEFDGVKLSWTESWTETTGSATEQNSARLQPDGRTFLGSSWVPALQTGRKFRLEKE